MLGPTSRAGAVEDYPSPADGIFRLTGHGNGHGIGLSQYGARNAATLGSSISGPPGYRFLAGVSIALKHRQPPAPRSRA